MGVRTKREKSSPDQRLPLWHHYHLKRYLLKNNIYQFGWMIKLYVWFGIKISTPKNVSSTDFNSHYSQLNRITRFKKYVSLVYRFGEIETFCV